MCVCMYHFNIRYRPKTGHVNVSLDFSHWTYSSSEKQTNNIMWPLILNFLFVNPFCLPPDLVTLVCIKTLITKPETAQQIL